jgi:hypothetical protein
MIRYLLLSCTGPLLAAAILCPAGTAMAQKARATPMVTAARRTPFSPEDLAGLKNKEDSLTRCGTDMVNGLDPAVRLGADSQFTRTLVRALRTPNSFYYPFDSLQTVSHIYAPDSSFRIFTWQLSMDEDHFRRHGAIQMRTPDGSLKLFALSDRTPVIERLMDTVTSNQYWIGNIYYNIVEKKYQGKNYYTLLGYDEHDFRSTRKWIEVLTFDGEGKPVFGSPCFSFSAGDPAHPAATIDRFMVEFKKEGGARLQYDPDLGLILFDHLVSESNEPDKKYTLVPDGDYEGFRWVNGKWVHINKVFTQKLQDGQAPVPSPLTREPGRH